MHRILGTCLGILFLMWFVSGIVMMYHTYPRIEKKQALAFAEDIDTCMLPIRELMDELLVREYQPRQTRRRECHSCFDGKRRIPFECPDGTSLRAVYHRTIATSGESMVCRSGDAERYAYPDRCLVDWRISVQGFPGLPLLFPGWGKGRALFVFPYRGRFAVYHVEIPFLGLGRGDSPLDLYQAVPCARAAAMDKYRIMGFRDRYSDDAFRTLCRHPLFWGGTKKA